jgi:hypothetical protein
MRPIDVAQLGMLLAAVQPGSVLGDLDAGHTGPDKTAVIVGRVFATHLGGGRPLGYGTVAATICHDSLVADSSATRYGGQQPGPLDPGTLMERTRLAHRTGPSKSAPEAWYALASVLAENRVPTDRLWYPPAAPWSQRTHASPSGTRFNEKFDESYTFFVQYRGGGIGNRNPMERLPGAVQVDQSLPIAQGRK